MENHLQESPSTPPIEVSVPPSEDERAVPWSIEQTFLGVFLTLVPWLLLNFGLQSLGGGTKTSQLTKPLDLGTDITNAVVTLVVSLTIQCAFLIAPVVFARRGLRARTGTAPGLREALRVLGFRSFRANWGRILLLVLLFLVVLLGVNALYSYLIQTFHWKLQTNDTVYLQDSKIAPITTYVLLFLAVFVAPFCEEVFFRGFVYPGFRTGMSIGAAVVLSAAIFGVAHADIGSFPVLLVIGVLLAILRWRSNSVWPGMLLHILNNALGALGILLYMFGIGR